MVNQRIACGVDPLAQKAWGLCGGERSGGAYGDNWHRDGMAANKQNSVDDLFAAADHLKKEGFASAQTLIIEGWSCGGVLVGAAVTQKPEAFAGMIAINPVLDLMRYNQFTGAHLWEAELGSSNDPKLRPFLEKFSPLEAAQIKRRYPAMLVTARKQDTRVVPMNSYKFVAAVKDHQIGSAPILLRFDEVGGHSNASIPKPARIDHIADIYAFAWGVAKAN